MNLDERIEALTMSLELLTHDHEDFKRRTDEMLAGMKEVLIATRDEQALIGQAVVKLTQIIANHEGRITGLEQQ